MSFPQRKNRVAPVFGVFGVPEGVGEVAGFDYDQALRGFRFANDKRD